METTTSTVKVRFGIKEIIRSLGLVFGDIGTSPIYTITIIFLLGSPRRRTIGVPFISLDNDGPLTIEYAWLAT